jgi:membrane protease YdiL (CAAX protease family)
MFVLRKIGWILSAGMLAFLIAIVPQGVWTALLIENLRYHPEFPWSVPIMVAALVGIWLWLGGKGWPHSISEMRRAMLRAGEMDRARLLYALVAGAIGVVGLCGLWIAMAVTVEIPASSLPNLDKHSVFFAYSLIGMGALVGAVLEEAGFRGYAQVMLEKQFSPITAALLSSVLFALGPHPPAHGFLLPKIAFYFLVAVLLATTALTAESIVPAIAVHALGLVVFFSLVWPHDAERKLIWNGGSRFWLWLHVIQFLVCSIASAAIFRRLVRRRRSKQAISYLLNESAT